MSNKIVPTVYRSIIDDVINAVQVDFEEYGMDEEVLQNLQAKWESKLLETRVADFARAPGAGDSPSSDLNDVKEGEPSQPAAGSSTLPPPPQQPAYGLAFPPGHGLALPGSSSAPMGNGQYGNGTGQGSNGDVKPSQEDLLRLRGGAINDDVKDVKDVKPVIKQEPNAAGLLPGDEVIDSDLDDSDDELKDEAEVDGEGEMDIVFCVYDKVQRVKNKWKTVFKDGMIHVNGRDYLFAKCNGEFEW